MPNELSEIKTYLEDRVGEEISVTVQMGRKKKKERKSFIEHYIEAVMREMIRKTIDETLRDLFRGFK